jgi:glucokinase
MKKLAVGVDIGGTNTVFGLVDKEGCVLAENSMLTQKRPEARDFIAELSRAIKKLSKTLPGANEIVGIGVGAPNGNYYRGTIEFAPNLRWKGVVNVVDLLKEHFDYKTIVLTNDANAAGIGEMIYGGAKGMKDFIMITLGTGLGSGIVVNGEMVYGHDGFAGELGHVVVDRGGRVCGCGRRGCLETYVSAPGIKRTVFELLADSRTDSELKKFSFEDLDSKQIYEAAKRGDPIALEAFDITCEILGKTLADAVAHTSPQAIFLFGGLANAKEFIFESTKKYMEENLLAIYHNKVKILPSKLSGADAAILGASALVWKEKA